MKNTKLKKEKGITLVALVITIVVLLILATVAIVSLSGENNIISKAQKAKADTQEGKTVEENRIAEYEAVMQGNSGNIWTQWGLTSSNVVFDKDYVVDGDAIDSNQKIAFYSDGGIFLRDPVDKETTKSMKEAGLAEVGTDYIIINANVVYEAIVFTEKGKLQLYISSNTVNFDKDSIVGSNGVKTAGYSVK